MIVVKEAGWYLQSTTGGSRKQEDDGISKVGMVARGRLGPVGDDPGLFVVAAE